MKKFFVLFALLLVFSVKSTSAQFHLELVYQTNYQDFHNLFVLDDKMWANALDGPLYFDGNQWSQLSQDGGQAVGPLAGIQRDDGSYFVTHHIGNRSYTWNEATNNFDYVNSPIVNARHTRVYSEEMIYIGTSTDHQYNDHARFYLWNGQDEFTLLVDWYKTVFSDCYPVSPDNVLILVTKTIDGELFSSLIRYNGNDFVDLYHFNDLNLDQIDVPMTITTIDENLFFITTYRGAIYLWVESSATMSLVHEPESYEEQDYDYGKKIFTNDNENLFILGYSALFHVKRSSGEIQAVAAYHDGQAYFYERIHSGYYDQVSNRMLFTTNAGELFELKLSTSTSDIVDNSDSFKVFPNPVKDRVFLEFSTYGSKLIELYSLNGSLLLKAETNQLQISLDATSLPKGVYLLRVLSDQGLASRKLVVN